ncbi:MAG: hypothetical protein Kow0069_08620 [Promethearchaeota archaeon]
MMMTEKKRRGIAKVTLRVDGGEVPIKDFVQDVLAGAVLGMVGTLRLVPSSPKKVELVVEVVEPAE